MLRIYCDSNVYRILMPSHRFHKKELDVAFEALKDKFVFCFSDAHLDDLKDSKPEYRDKDLEFMGKYVKDNYFYYNHIGKKGFECYLATPGEAFAGKDYEAAQDALSNPLDIASLLEDADDSREVKMAVNFLKSYFDLPIAALGGTIDTTLMDEKSKKWMDKILPGYNPFMSIKEMMNSMTPFGVDLLHNEKDVTELRKYIGEYLNRETYSFEKWGLAFNEKFKETGVDKTYLQMIDNMLTDNQKKDFYLRFSYAYSMLEMFNITQERQGGRLKKFTYDSLNIDALHAYFASFCDYLVTDDKGLQVKAHIVYQLFGFQTKVLSTEDFINLKSILVGQEETLEKFIESIKYDLKHSFQIREKVNIADGSILKTYKTTHVYFNYFNRMQIITNENGTTLALYCERRNHGNFFMYRESEILIKKMIAAFGIDDEGKGLYNLDKEENGNPKDTIRQWTKNGIVISFEESQKKDWGNFLCLRIDLGND